MSTTSALLGRPVGANGEETRQRIIAATMRCVAEVGYSQSTIREIARLAQVTSSVLYHYFPSKGELITATFTDMAELAVPRLALAAQRTVGVLAKLLAVLDECEQIHRDYPYAAAFDRAIRAESARHLHLDETSESLFGALQAVILDIIKEGSRQGALAPGVSVRSASIAIFALIRGLNEITPAARSVEDYHKTVRALKALIGGSLFNYDKLT